MDQEQPLVRHGELRCMCTRLVYLSASNEATFNSVIRFYDVHFNTTLGLSPAYSSNSVWIISANRLKLDTFIVNSMAMIGNTSLLALGIQEFGILIYDVMAFKIIQEVPFKKGYTFASLDPENSFKITHIISQTNQVMFYAVVNNQMIFSVVRNEAENENDILEFTNAFEENFETQMSTMSKELAVSHMGFAFIQNADASDDEDEKPNIKFFRFYGMGNSKGVGELRLEANDDCKYLNNLPMGMAMKISKTMNLTTGMMITAAICGGSALKIKAFEFHPSLTLNLSHSDEIVHTREIVISGSNAYIDTPLNVTLSLQIQDRERNLDGRLYLAYAVLPALMFAVLTLLKKWNNHHDEFVEEK